MILPNGFISFHHAKKILGYRSIRSLYNLIDRGKLKKYKFMNKVCLKESEVKALAEPVLVDD